MKLLRRARRERTVFRGILTVENHERILGRRRRVSSDYSSSAAHAPGNCSGLAPHRQFEVRGLPAETN